MGITRPSHCTWTTEGELLPYSHSQEGFPKPVEVGLEMSLRGSKKEMSQRMRMQKPVNLGLEMETKGS